VLLVNTERGELLIDVLERRAPAAE
jgi:hypothetical protein